MIKTPYEPATIKNNILSLDVAEAKRLILFTGHADKLAGHNECAKDPRNKEGFGICVNDLAKPYYNEVGSLRVLNSAIDPVYLTKLDGTDPVQVQPAGYLLENNLMSISRDSYSLTEEVIIQNNSPMNDDAVIVDDCSVATGWNRIYGENIDETTPYSITAEDGRVKYSVKADSSGRARIYKYYGTAFSDCDFIKVTLETSCAGTIYIDLADRTNLTSYIWNNTRFPIEADTPTTFVLPIKAVNAVASGAAGVGGMLPRVLPATFVYNNIRLYLGVDVPADTVFSWYVDEIIAIKAKPVCVEMQVPNYLENPSLTLQCFTGTQYETVWAANLNTGYSEISLDLTKFKFLDQTLVDIYKTTDSKALFPKGNGGETVTGYSGLSTTYTENLPLFKKIGFMMYMPPSDERSNINELQLKFNLKFDKFLSGNAELPEIGTLYTSTANVVLKNVDNTGGSVSLLPNTKVITQHITTNSITNEFILRNDDLDNSAVLADNCSDVTGWTAEEGYGTDVTITSEAGRLKVTGTTNATGLVRVFKNYATPFDLSTKNFMTFDFEANATGSAYCSIGETSSSYNVRWIGKPCVSATANVNSRIAVSFKVPPFESAIGSGPNGNSGEPNFSSIRCLRFGFSASPNTAYTFYVDNISFDTGKSAYVEMQVPDELDENATLTAQCWTGTATGYETFKVMQLNSVPVIVSEDESKLKFLDGTILSEAYGQGLGQSYYPKGNSEQVVTGLANDILTYSAVKGNLKRIAVRIDLPPANNGKTELSRIRLKLILKFAFPGYTTYVFSNSSDLGTGLQLLEKPYFCVYDPEKRLVDYYILSAKPTGLQYTYNTYGEISNVIFTLAEDTKIFHGMLKLNDLSTDSNADLIPDFVARFQTVIDRLKFVQGEITFTTTGSTFSPILTVAGDPLISWEFGDGTTSSLAAPSVDFGSAATRINKVRVTPWSALKKINIGYDASDNGVAPGPDTLQLLSQQNVTTVTGLHNATHLEMWASNRNPITSLDFADMQYLHTIECYSCSSLAHVNFRDVPNLARVCLESCHLSELNLSNVPALADLRSAVNANPFNIIWGNTGQSVWHICTRSNHFASAAPIPDLTQFPVLQELLIYSSFLTGTLEIKGSKLYRVRAQYNQFSNVTIADDCTALKDLYLTGNGLSQQVVDYVLERLDTLGKTGGQLYIAGTNAAPSVTGLVHKTNLKSKGWVVTTN